MIVSELGFGAMRLPIGETNPDYSQAVALLRHAIRMGINFFDVGTFYCHGHCEKAFGLATKDVPHKQILICGKNASHHSHNPDWTGHLKNTLAIFNRSSFDLYFIHALNWKDWESYFLGEGVIQQVKEAKSNGLVRHLGFSSHDSPEKIARLVDTGIFEAVILSYNILKRNYEAAMKYAFDKGLGVIVMNPLLGGTLADLAMPPAELTYKHHAKNMAMLGLNFVLSQPFIHCVLSGMESKMIIDENIEVVNKSRLPEEEIANLKEWVDKKKERNLIPCTSCGYCLPCTQGINIPEVIRILNEYAVFEGKKVVSRQYSMLSATAECCIRCNLCFEKCTQHIKIPDVMENAARLFAISG